MKDLAAVFVLLFGTMLNQPALATPLTYYVQLFDGANTLRGAGFFTAEVLADRSSEQCLTCISDLSFDFGGQKWDENSITFFAYSSAPTSLITNHSLNLLNSTNAILYVCDKLFAQGCTGSGEPTGWYFSLNNESDLYDGLGSVRTAVPEPAACALFGLGLAGLGFQRRRRAA